MSIAVLAKMTLVARVLLVVAMAVILYEASISNPYDPGIGGSDKMLHGLAFFALSALIDFSFPGSGFGFTKTGFLLAFGLVIEFEQSFLPWRSADLADFLADGAGMFLYALCIPLLRQVPLLRNRWSS